MAVQAGIASIGAASNSGEPGLDPSVERLDQLILEPAPRGLERPARWSVT